MAFLKTAKNKRLQLSWAVLFFALWFPNVAYAENLIPNPDMEAANPLYWYPYKNPASNQLIYALDYTKAGKRSLKIVNFSFGASYWKGTKIDFRLPYPKTLRFSGWLKAEGISPTSSAFLDFYINFQDGTSLWYNSDTMFPKGTYNWTNKAITKTFTKAVRSITPYLRLNGTGTVWFDNIEILKDNYNYLFNPTMELAQPVNWYGFAISSNQVVYADDSFHSGSRSLAIVNTRPYASFWSGDRVNLTPPYPKTLSFSGWAKANNIAPNSSVSLNFYITLEDNSSILYNADTQFPKGTYDWTNKAITKTFTKGVKSIRPELKLTGPGVVWFDDVEVALSTVPILSISVNPKLWDIGLTEVNRAVTMDPANKITVINDGTDPETFTLSLVNPPGWTASTTPGRDIYVLSGIFCNSTDIPQPSQFNQDDPQQGDDIISTDVKIATSGIFGYAQATANGVAVPSGNNRPLYLQFKSPTATDKTTEQDISVIISCQTP